MPFNVAIEEEMNHGEEAPRCSFFLLTHSVVCQNKTLPIKIHFPGRRRSRYVKCLSFSVSLSLFLLFSVLSCIMFHCWEFFMPSSVFSIFHFVFDCDIVQFLCCYNKIEWVELQPIQSQPTFMPINCVA